MQSRTVTTRKAKQYIATAVESLTLAIELFNRPSSTGREHATVMLAAHAFEMLLKAAIYESRGTVKFGAGDRSFDLGKCIRVGETSLGVLDAGDRVVLQALKEDRDTAIHDVIMMSDDVLWLHLRSSVTIFRRILNNLTGQDLTDVMPGRVLPVSAHPPTDVSLVVEKEVEHITQLLQPGRRQSADARARLLPLMALDRAAQGVEEPVAERDVSQIVSRLKAGDDWSTVFPGVVGLKLVGGLRSSDQQQEITLKIDKRGKIPVRLAGEGEEAVAYPEVDTFDTYSIAPSKFGEKLGLTAHQGYAVIYALDLRNDPKCFKEKRASKGYVKFSGFSNRALERAKTALSDELDVKQAVADYNARNRKKAQRKSR